MYLPYNIFIFPLFLIINLLVLQLQNNYIKNKDKKNENNFLNVEFFLLYNYIFYSYKYIIFILSLSYNLSINLIHICSDNNYMTGFNGGE